MLIQYSTIKYHPNLANCKLRILYAHRVNMPTVFKKAALNWAFNLHFFARYLRQGCCFYIIPPT